MLQQLREKIIAIKDKKPLILNITNYVTMDFIANGLLSIGASPIMCHSKSEMEDLLQHANALVINMGTLNDEFVELCEHACQIANRLKKPIILDPVGSGASHYRTDTYLSLINKYDIAILRGNASEIMSLSGSLHQTKGVDSLDQSHEAIVGARELAKQKNLAIVISGKIDCIIDQDRISQYDRGSPLMPFITGTGCLLSAVVAAFHAIEKDRFKAAELATLFYGICGEIAEQKSNGPGSFRMQFLDALNIIPERDHYENH